ncbi:MAG: DUF4398 domain-containing protein [Gammaproteobacteria bacterium]
MSRRYCFKLLILGMITLLSCASIPTQEMSDARQAVQAARDSGAEMYATEELNQAVELLNKARNALEEDAYEQARSDAVAAKQVAVKARSKSLEKKTPRPGL